MRVRMTMYLKSNTTTFPQLQRGRVTSLGLSSHIVSVLWCQRGCWSYLLQATRWSTEWGQTRFTESLIPIQPYSTDTANRPQTPSNVRPDSGAKTTNQRHSEGIKRSRYVKRHHIFHHIHRRDQPERWKTTNEGWRADHKGQCLLERSPHLWRWVD